MGRHHRITITRLSQGLVASGLAVLAIVLGLAVSLPAAAQQGSPLHPVFPLLDADGNHVLQSGKPVSTLETCGSCHDVDFITVHNAHDGILTGEIGAPAGETVMMDRTTGRLVVLSEAAKSVEMNCFLCHGITPNNTARLEALASGDFAWANTATLLGTGIVEQTTDGYTWNPAAFDAEGNLLPEYVQVQDPSVNNCGQCHGMATTDPITPLVLDTCGVEQGMTIRTGQVFSPQRISESGLNIQDKDLHARTWDVHAERVVGCTDCHYALNNPAYATDPDAETPAHLSFDPRRLEPGEYLYRPLHEFARSDADVLTGESCASCHDVRVAHAWLPYFDRHTSVLACETCHVPQLELSARQMIDWTVLTASGAPNFSCRGLVTEVPGAPALIAGYEPALLQSEEADGSVKIAPYNLITTYYWAYGQDEQPVALADLRAAYFDGEAYHADVQAAFDADGDGKLSQVELVIDSPAKEAVIAGRLAELGMENPRIVARIEAYPIHHSVTHGEWATRDCRACHGDQSRLAQPVALVSNPPGGVLPTFEGDLGQGGQIVSGEDGSIYFQPFTGTTGDRFYLFGYSSSKVVDWAGAIIFLGTLGAVFTHGGLRVLAARRRVAQKPELRSYYMYSVYERFWHWLQTAAIMLLIFTGLVIHKPDMFGMFSFAYVVQVHNVLAALLVINAALSLFYHLASGEIRQFLPRPYGFFDQAILQAKFYLQGIFRGERHPFAKVPEKKLNPLQQITYLGLLNVLLPLQIITGALMWGLQRWPELAQRLGGLPFLSPLHTLVAWLFASFVVAHVYLTTTGHEPLASIKAMIIGYDEVEVHAGAD